MGGDEAVADGVHGFDGVHLGNELTDNPHAVERCVIMQQIVAACRRLNEVDGREDTLVGERAVELDFRVTSTLELFEDHLIHLTAGIYQCRRDDGERSAALDVTGSTEEALGLLQGIGINTTGEHLA